jgi:hypothetical protein
MFTGYKQKYVSVEELGKFFGFSAISIEGGKSAKIGHIYYNKMVVPINGKAFVEAPTFFKFFDMPYQTVNNSTYTVNTVTNPMFDLSQQRSHPNAKVLIDGKPFAQEVYSIKNRIYVQITPLEGTLGAKHVTDANGKMTLRNKQIDHWKDFAGDLCVQVDDLAEASGRKITVDFK